VPLRHQLTHDLSQEEGVTAGDDPDAIDDLVARLLTAHLGDEGGDLGRREPAQRDAPAQTRNLAEELRSLRASELALPVRADDDDAPILG
jgi:hypothetical protein